MSKTNDKTTGEHCSLNGLVGWISVSEELPRDGRLVLIWASDGNGFPDCAFRDLGLWYCRAGGLQNVTHWMPLPNPPNTPIHREERSDDRVK